MADQAAPPVPDDYPVEGYEITVTRYSDSLKVAASLTHRWPDGSIANGWQSFDGDHEYVYEPCRLFRLFGDSIERRVERAKATVAQRAEQAIAKRRRFDAALQAVI